MNCHRCRGLLYLDDGEVKCFACSRVQVSEAELRAREYVLAEYRADTRSRRREPKTPTREASERVLSYRVSSPRADRGAEAT